MGEIKRHPERGSEDRAVIRAILADGLVAHVGIIDSSGAPVVIPMAYALDEDSLLIHGSVASRLMRTAGPICVTVTVLDGLVVARSLFNSSMNYRSVVVTGVPQVLEGEEREKALLTLSDFLLPKSRQCSRTQPSRSSPDGGVAPFVGRRHCKDSHRSAQRRPCERLRPAVLGRRGAGANGVRRTGVRRDIPREGHCRTRARSTTVRVGHLPEKAKSRLDE